MKQDASTISWNNLGDEWLTLAQTGESRMMFIMPYMLELFLDFPFGKAHKSVSEHIDTARCG